MSSPAEHPAPALARGIQLLRLLGEQGATSLEELSKRLKLPKSSLLRLAETLQSLDLVERRPDKKFTALAVLRPNSQQEERRRSLIANWLDARAADSGSTQEWYEWTRERTALEIVQRREPPTGDVVVRARQGFSRVLNGELEAVSQVALAFEGVPPSADHWQWGMDAAGMAQVPVTDPRAVLESVKRAGFGCDTGYNIHGVRRLAFPIMTGAHLVAIAAVALTFRPDGERMFVSVTERMAEAVARLQKELDLLYPSNPSQICP